MEKSARQIESGMTVRALMALANLTQTEMARVAGVSPRAVSNYARSAVIPSRAIMQKLIVGAFSRYFADADDDARMPPRPVAAA